MASQQPLHSASGRFTDTASQLATAHLPAYQ